ncbi:putative disease resistance RPP13-like protein 1 [Carex rostrata]
MVVPLATAAIGWGFSNAGWLISPILTRLLNKCFDELGLDPKFQSRKQILLKKLEDLHTKLLPQLLILTDAAKQSPHFEAAHLEKWLQKLKFAFYEAEHVLGLVEYQRLEKKVNSLFPSTSKSISKKLKDKLPKFSSEKKDLIKILENLENIVKEGMEFVALLNLPSSSGNNSTWSSRETISIPDSTVIGRDEDRDRIVKLLRETTTESTSTAESYSVIGIWGMGGSGKTTLAQYVCEHEKEVKYFDCVMWAHVSQKFSVHTIMRKIWESVSGSSCPNYENLDVLMSQVANKLRGKKYLLVLDDVWCDKGVSEQELNQLFAPLRDGKRGSKILVTTRNAEAARALCVMDPMKLPELSDEDFLSLFVSHALNGVKVNEHLEKELKAIGVKIVGKLCRLPLAAITVAGQLRRRPDPEFWSSMLNRSLLNDTMGALFLSYQYLPPSLQRCFAFCSLFPKGHQFEHDNLVNLWIAEGFIETEDSIEHMKDIANRYILELVSSSFFQISEFDSNHYSIHDLMHDLAEHVSEGECFRIEIGEEKEIPSQTRHLFVGLEMFEEYMERIYKLKYLVTIFVQMSSSNIYWKQVDLEDLFMNSKKLYVVHMQAVIVKRVPKSVIHLRNLRYLNLVTSQLDETHNSLNRLYQLRFLYSSGQIPDVGRLILLQDLTKIDVRTTSGFELKQLEHLSDLYGLLSINGLHNVESKEEAYRAKLSDKKGLQKLHFSWDYESRDVQGDIDVEILDGLCPPPQIKKLTIKGYRGRSFPRWILENNDNIIHLQHLEVADCGGLEALHRINELSNLLFLTISFLPKLKSWVSLPLTLTQLEISHCLSLAFVLKEDLEMIMSTQDTRISQIVTFMGNSQTDFIFQRVQEMMKLSDHDSIDEQTYSIISTDFQKCLEKMLDLICQLKDVYGELFLPPALRELRIKSCFITDKILNQSLHGLTSLTQLTLEDIITITCISEEVLNSLNNLMVLGISGCLLLRSIGGWDTHSTLEEFNIVSCPNLILETSVAANNRGKTEPSILKKVIFGTSRLLRSIGDWDTHSSLAEFNIVSCPNLILETSVATNSRGKTGPSVLKSALFSSCMPPNNMHGLVSLETLWIWDCPTIVDLHIGPLKSLVDLAVQRCPNLVSLRGLGDLCNLKCLNVLGCQKLECYADADKMIKPNNLYISRLSLIKELISRDGFSSLVSLYLYDGQQEYFSEEECEVLRDLPSLEEIDFYNCKIRTLPTLQYLRSLRILSIASCVNLTSLPDLPPSVEIFLMNGCNEVLTRSCKDTSDPNWHKISHIPDKQIR